MKKLKIRKASGFLKDISNENSLLKDPSKRRLNKIRKEIVMKTTKHLRYSVLD